MITRTLVLAIAVTAATACKKESPPEAVTAGDKPVPTEPAPKPADPATPRTAEQPAAVDHSDPVKVVEHVFAAAAAGKSDGLAGLCDPAGGGDGDVKEVCGATANGPKWEEFVTYFAKGKVSGPAKIDGDSAAVEILFGPGGDKKETMNLKKIDGKWYLDGF